MWKMSNDEEWVAVADDGTVTGTPSTALTVEEHGTAPIPYHVLGPAYTPRGTHDPVAQFLMARYLLGDGAKVTGTPPVIPPAPAGDGCVIDRPRSAARPA